MRGTWVALFGCFLAVSIPVAAQEPEANEALLYPVLYADANGVTHFRDESLSWSAGPSLGTHVTELLTAQQVGVARFDAGLHIDWHAAPRKQFVMVLEGLMEVVAGDGERRTFAPGSVLLVTDTEGPGHQTNALGDRDVLLARTPVP